MYIPWQIEQDISRSRLEEISAAARYAYRNAESRRRPMRRIASILQWVSGCLADAVPRRAVDRRKTAIETPTADVGRPDLRLTVVAINGLEDSWLGAGEVLEGGQGMTLVHFGHQRLTGI